MSQTVAQTRRNFSPWFQWMTRLGATVHEDPLDVTDRDRFDAWRLRCRTRLAQLVGPFPDAVPLAVETLESEPCDGYRRDKVVFDTEDTMSVPSYLLVPDRSRAGGPGRGVLAVHGHGPGKASVCGIEQTEDPEGDYAVQLARNGSVVLAPDLRCFGERADWNPPDHYVCDTNLVHAVMAGVNPLTQNLWDLMRSIDLLAGQPQVDPARIGVVGFSYGATLALFLAALDDRVQAVVVSGYFSSWAESHKVPWNMCGSQVLAGMLGRLEHEDLGALVAPRPMLVQTGTEDLLFPLAAARAAVRAVRAVYDLFGVPERLEHDVFEGGHRWHAPTVAPFLGRWLS